MRAARVGVRWFEPETRRGGSIGDGGAPGANRSVVDRHRGRVGVVLWAVDTQIALNAWPSRHRPMLWEWERFLFSVRGMRCSPRVVAGLVSVGLLVACGGDDGGGADPVATVAETPDPTAADDNDGASDIDDDDHDDDADHGDDDDVNGAGQTDDTDDDDAHGDDGDHDHGEVGAVRAPGVVEGTPRSGPVVEVTAPQLPTTVVDAAGETVEVVSIDRIVSLQADLSEFLFSFGLADRVVGVDNQSAIAPGMEGKEVVGSSFELSAEGVLALEPTLVLMKDNAGPPAAIDAIRAAGIPLVVVRTDVALDVAAQTAVAVGAAVGDEAAGERLAALIEADIDAGRQIAATLPAAPTVAYVNIGRGTGPGILGLAGPVHPLIDAAGGVDVAVELGIDEPMVPLAAEALLAVEPDVILTGAINLETAGGFDEFVALPGIAGTRAVVNSEVFAYDMSFVLARGPRTGMAVLELAELFAEVAARS